MKLYLLLVSSILAHSTMLKSMYVAAGSSSSSESESDITLTNGHQGNEQIGETTRIKQQAQVLAANKDASPKETAALGTQLTKKRAELLKRILDWKSRITLLSSEIDSIRSMYDKYGAVLATTTQNEESYRALYKKLCDERDALKFYHLIEDDSSKSDDDSNHSNNDDDNDRSEISVDDARTRIQKDLGNILDPSNEKIRILIEGIRASLQSLKELQVKLETKKKQAEDELKKASENHQKTLESVHEIEDATLSLKDTHPSAVVAEVVEAIEERREEERRNAPLPQAAQPEKKSCLLL